MLQIDQGPPQMLRPGKANPLPWLLALQRIEVLAQAAVLALVVIWLKTSLPVELFNRDDAHGGACTRVTVSLPPRQD